MRTLIASCLAAIAFAQDGADSKTYTQALYTGASDGGKLNIDSRAVGASVAQGGALTIVTTIDYPTLARYNVVQSWVSFMGAADNGSNVLAIGNAINTTRPITMQSYKACGKVGDDYAKPGYNSIRSPLTTENCSLAVQQTFKQLAPTKFQHTAIVPFGKTESQATLKMGQMYQVRTGVTVYVNPGGSTPAMDSQKTGFVEVRADGAMALTMGGVAAALYAMSF